MKSIFTLFILACTTVQLSAQVGTSVNTDQQSATAIKTTSLQENANPVPAAENAFPVQRLRSSEVQIGTSKYDLQTNAAMQRRIINRENGSISAVWTFSAVNSWATRGTGYNYFNGSSWGSAPTSPIETERVGWPSLLHPSNGGEVIISHSTASFKLRNANRTSVGSGSWN